MEKEKFDAATVIQDQIDSLSRLVTGLGVWREEMLKPQESPPIFSKAGSYYAGVDKSRFMKFLDREKKICEVEIKRLEGEFDKL